MDPLMRASDEDRERAVAAMREHAAAGRLTVDEFAERSAAAYQSRTFGELHALTRDLPAPAPPPPARRLRPILVPALAVAFLAVLLGVTLVLLNGADPASAASQAPAMHQMMSHMMGC